MYESCMNVVYMARPPKIVIVLSDKIVNQSIDQKSKQINIKYKEKQIYDFSSKKEKGSKFNIKNW